MEIEEEDDEIPSEFISRRELEKNRLSREGTTVTINYVIEAVYFVVIKSLSIFCINLLYVL